MTYDKQDAIMTRGMAILCMVILHLFCRKGADVFGTPLIWLNQDTPLVYWFGFYSEICVSVYSICMGYAQYMLYKNGKASWKDTFSRILKLMINYWIILVMFSIAGLLYSGQNDIPGTWLKFLKSIVLLHSYNGAWWFLNTYILYLLIPPSIKFILIEKLSVSKGLIACFVFQIIWYLINKMGLLPSVPADYTVLSFIVKEVNNLIGILPSAYVGSFMFKGNLISVAYASYYSYFENARHARYALAIIWIILFVSMNILHKAVLTMFFAVSTFIMFNIWKKGKCTESVFTFLGAHSTNIWLMHMFFYVSLFKGLVQIAKYPIFMLLFMLFLCILTSYVEMTLEKTVRRIVCMNS